MKKSVKDMEPKELQKYVEKLKKENKSLKRDKRNLERRLTTSQNNRADALNCAALQKF